MDTNGDIRVETTICHASLVKIFDNWKGYQDPYVQLVRVHPDGREAEFARTITIKEGNLAPRWDDEMFSVAKAGGKLLRLRLYCEHSLRNDKMCGEVDVEFDWLLGRLRSQSAMSLDLALTRKGESTGTLRVGFSLARSTSPEGRISPAGGKVAGRTQQQSSKMPEQPEKFKAELQRLLNRPEELDERIRVRFRQMAKPGQNGELAMQYNDTDMVRKLLAEKLGVPEDVFGEIHQMFWRFEVSGQGCLYEKEAVKMVLCMLRQYRDAISDTGRQVQQLSRAIKTMEVSEKFEIVKELGRGGQGVAYLAKSKAGTQEVVVKMYAKTNQKGAVEEISQEFKLLTILKHPKIARVFDIFQDWNNVYIVQEPYFGGDLTKAVQNAYNANVRVDEAWVSGVMLQVLMGCEFLHNHGVVHSDIKEPNVMVASHEDWQNPQVIVIDFGLANKFSSKSGVGGTPGYMPPEVWDWGLWTPRGDVFSIAVMMFTLRTGRQPFNPDGRKSLDEIKKTTSSEEPVMDRGSEQMKALVGSMLQKKFLQRPMCGQIMQDPWFKSVGGKDHEVEMSALQALAGQRQRTELQRALITEVASRENLAQLRELNETFLRLDVNNDGNLSADELREGLRDIWRSADIERLVSVLGMNEGGEVSYEQFLGELLAAKEPEENAMLQRLFKDADINDRGYLGPEELRELSTRPGMVQMLGSQENAYQQLCFALDSEGRGQVTFEKFKRAIQGDGGQKVMRSYSEGDTVAYWSSSHGVWIPCAIVMRDEVRGLQIDCKPDFWLAWDRVEKFLRPGESRAPQGYREGQGVELYSTTYSAWIPCRIVAVDPETGSVQVDQKPGYWFRGDELQTRLKASTGAPPPQQDGQKPRRTGAAIAGVGRQLLGGAFGGVFQDPLAGGRGGR